MNRLRRYDILVWAASADLIEMRDACLQTTWDDAYAGRSRISAIASTSIEESIKTADVFVCIFRSVSEDLLRHWRFATANLKPVLLFQFGTSGEPMCKEVEKLLESSLEGSRFKLVVEEPCAFAKDYLIALHGAVRVLDGLNTPPDLTESAYFANRFFQRLSSRMSNWWVVHHRSHVNPVLKQAVADFVLDRYLRRFVGAGVFKLYFESGSSVAFLSQAFAARLDDGWLKLWAEFEIETNNIFSYLEFLAAPSQRTLLFPEGPPDHKYGATYGRLLSVEPPDTRDRPITDRAREVVTEIRDHLQNRYKEKGIIFAAASGIDSERGPHVGSYPNMLFKRATLESYCPTLILVDEDKLPYQFDPETCYSVCDEEFSWRNARQKVPLAIACAFRNRENAVKLEPQLRALGFRHIDSGSRHHTPWCIIAANDKFALEVEKWERACDVSYSPPSRPTNLLRRRASTVLQ